jgi:hypothetical protein
LRVRTSGARRFRRSKRAIADDVVACALSLAESLVRLDLRTSKRNSYAAPLAKLHAGEFKRLSPG